MPYLAEAMQACKKHIANLEFTANPVIATWREAFRKFKTKKGARCSIEAMLKRVFNGNEIGSIIPLVDIYNGISLTYGVPIGGEDIDKFDGDVHLTLANGSEEFVTYGSDKSEPPYPGEVVYKDNAGAICRCWNWRESVRTMLTEETTNALMIIETVGGEEADAVLEEALDALAQEFRKNSAERFAGMSRQPKIRRLRSLLRDPFFCKRGGIQNACILLADWLIGAFQCVLSYHSQVLAGGRRRVFQHGRSLIWWVRQCRSYFI